MLADDEDPDVRFAVAMKRKLDTQLFEKLAGDPAPAVRRRIALNPKCPSHILRRLAKTTKTSYEPPLRPDSRRKIANHHETVRRRLSRSTGLDNSSRRATGTSGPASMPALSAKIAHPALVAEQDFIATQQIRAARPTTDGQDRQFALAGLIHCGVCDRRLDSHWNHGRPTYRCRHGHTSTQRAGQPRPKTLYIREDHLVDEISIRLGDEGNDGHATPIRGIPPVFGEIMRSY